MLVHPFCGWVAAKAGTLPAMRCVTATRSDVLPLPTYDRSAVIQPNERTDSETREVIDLHWLRLQNGDEMLFP